MQPHTGAVITIISHFWPQAGRHQPSCPTWLLPLEVFPHKLFEVYTEYYKKTKLHSVRIERINLRTEELEFTIGKDWPCHLKVRLNYVRDEVEFIEHSHGTTQEKFSLFLPRRLEGRYYSEPVGGFSTKHFVEGTVIDSEATQIKFADSFEGDKENPRAKYNYQYECKILARY